MTNKLFLSTLATAAFAFLGFAGCDMDSAEPGQTSQGLTADYTFECAEVSGLGAFDHLVSVNRSPIDKLSNEAFMSLRDSLEFNEKGITSFKYDRLKAELSAEDYEHVLGMLGLDSGFKTSTSCGGGILEGYRCMSTGNCKAESGWACTSNC
jgi:hypothetical protein